MKVYVIIREYTLRSALTKVSIPWSDVKIVDSEKKAIDYIVKQHLDIENTNDISPWMNYIHTYGDDDLATIRYEPHDVG